MVANLQSWVKGGTLVEAAGNAPFLLNQGRRAWLVLSGGVDLFAVALADGRPAGAHDHLFRVSPEQAMWEPPENAGQKVGILAVALPDTRLAQMDQAAVLDLARRPQEEDQLQLLLETWICQLSHLLARLRPSPRLSNLRLQGGKTATLAAGQIARSQHDLIWVRPKRGQVKLLGFAYPAAPEAAAWPLGPSTWLEAATDAELEVLTTSAWFQSDPDWQSLTSFHRVTLEGLARGRRSLRESEARSLQNHLKAGKEFLQNAFTSLASIIQPAPHPLWTEVEDPLVAASRVVAQAAGLEIKPPPRNPGSQDQGYRLRELARVSRFQMRAVTLEGEWWRRDNGPLLGFTAAHNQPVALLPRGVRAYRLEDPAQNTVSPVTPEVAAGLSPTAYVFYRPFPEMALTALNLLRFSLRGMGRDLATVFLMGGLGGLLGLMTPVATGLLFDYIIPGDARGQLFQLTLGLMVVALAHSMFTLTRNLAMLRLEGKMDYSLQAAVWDYLLKLPAPFFRKYSSGDLAMRANAIAAIRQHLSSSMVTSVMTMIFSVFSLGLLFYYSVSLALVALVIVMVAALLTLTFGFLELRYQKPMFDLQGAIAGLALQLFSGLGKLHVAGAEERGLSSWTRLFTRQNRLSYRIQTYANILDTIYAALPVVATGILFYWTAFHLGLGRISTGDLMAFLGAFGILFSAISAMSDKLVDLLNVIPLYQRAQPILEARPEVDENKKEPRELAGALEVAHLSFRYDQHGPLILHDVSFRVEPGEFVALTGPSGSGKSSLFRLLLGFEKPSSGAIYLDGQDLASLDLQALRRQMGVVLQEGELMPGTILSNIIATSHLTEADAWEAARRAGLDEDIKNMPMGMYTFISEGGGTFSGGQKQRLLIARAIAPKPRFLLFDEATSALDNRTQAIVSQSLEELRATRLVIAHRLSTIMHADRILVLEKGKLIQSGTYQELSQQPGLFANLAKRQIA